MPELRAAARVAARALELVGTRFRPQGRSPEHGLDCLGLVAVAAGIPAELVPTGYSLRSEAPPEKLDMTFGGRVQRIDAREAEDGDVLLVSPGSRQHHLLVLVRNGFVHADLRSARVVERPGAVPWPVVAAWRVEEIG